MARLALYRQMRPRRFSTLVGQEHIATILRNQIKNQHLSHAYLFCGTRGTGKTSAAKILAQAINCLHSDEGEPCGQCAICTLSENPDVFEIDAASNNGVDQIRDLREKVRFAPLESKYKVYIIDEVHMLSSGAFNALLKTLEEPPAHVVFILATTEPQKLPATILSRCQRFDFRRISTHAIERHLIDVLGRIDATHEEKAVQKIALLADGSMRDALSIADQCLSFGGLRYDSVIEALGTSDDDQRFSLVEALLQRDGHLALQQLDALLSLGKDVSALCRDLLSHFRALLLLSACQKDALSILQISEEDYQLYQQQSQNNTTDGLFRATEILSQADMSIRRAALPRLYLETAFLRICRIEEEQDIDALVARISALEQKLASKTPTPEDKNKATCVTRSTENLSSVKSKEDETPLDTDFTELKNPNEIFTNCDKPSSLSPSAQTDAKTIFTHLQSSQGEGIRQIFKMYHWETVLVENSFYVRAPAACLPALLQTLKNKEAAFSETLQAEYPQLRVHFLAANETFPAGSSPAEVAAIASSPASSIDQNATKFTEALLFQRAISLFGANNVQRKH